MAIPIKKEDKEYFEDFRCYENCYFCGKSTDTWHEKTNNPVCGGCSKSHRVTELPNRFKGETRKDLQKGNWYTTNELKKYLMNNNYSEFIADELCEQYAKNLQLAYEKGLKHSANEN